MTRFVYLLVLCSLLLLPGNAGAYENWEEELSSTRAEIDMARPLGMGRAFLAIAEGIPAYLYNPAGIAQRQQYLIGIDTAFEPTGKSWAASAALLDSITSALCMEVGYTYSGYDSKALWPDKLQLISADERREYANFYEDILDIQAVGNLTSPYKDATVHRHIVRSSIAGAINQYFMMGTTVKYAYVDRPDRHNVNAATVDVGIMFRTDFGLQGGLVGYNLVHAAYNLWPLKLGIGLAYTITDEFYITYDQLVIFDVYQEKTSPLKESDDDSDVVVTPDYENPSPVQKSTVLGFDYEDGTKIDCRAGIEYIIMKMVPLRAGYEYDQIKENHYVGAGIGYHSQKVLFDLSYNQGLVDKTDRMFSLSLAFTI